MQEQMKQYEEDLKVAESLHERLNVSWEFMLGMIATAAIMLIGWIFLIAYYCSSYFSTSSSAAIRGGAGGGFVDDNTGFYQHTTSVMLKINHATTCLYIISISCFRRRILKILIRVSVRRTHGAFRS